MKRTSSQPHPTTHTHTLTISADCSIHSNPTLPNLNKMNVFILGVFCGLLVACTAAPAKLDEVKPIAIVRSASENNADGSFAYSFEGEDGTKMEASGNQKQVGPKPEDVGTVSRGSYSFTSPDGVVLTVNWTADENGFQATGDHLPTPPPMPEHVVKMLADLKAAGLL